MVWHGSTYIVPQDRSFRGTLYFFGQVDSVPWGLAVYTLTAVVYEEEQQGKATRWLPSLPYNG